MIGKVVSDLRLFHNTSVDSGNTDATHLQFPDLWFVFFVLREQALFVQTETPRLLSQSGRSQDAEREGFEPSVRLPAHTLSKRAPSATRTPLPCRLPLNAPVGLLFLGFGAGVVKFHAAMRSKAHSGALGARPP